MAISSQNVKILPVNDEVSAIRVSAANNISTILPNSGKLSDYDVYIQDIDIDSKYFRVSKVPNVLSAGKNYFIITGTPLLKPNTTVAVEVLDVKGNPLEIVIPDILLNGTDRIVVIRVKQNDYYGPALITILGEALDVPREWVGAYNVKWQKKVLVNPTLDNDDDVIFVKNPSIEFNEIYDAQGQITKVNIDKTIFNQGLMYSKIAGEKLSPLMQYQLYLTDGPTQLSGSNFDSLDAWYTGSIYVHNASVSDNKLYFTQSYGMFGITMGVTQSLAMRAHKKYTLKATFVGTESNLAGSVASALVYSGSNNIMLYMYTTSSSDVELVGEFSSSVDITASVELTGQAFAISTVWSDVQVYDYVTGSSWYGFTKEMEGGKLIISESNMIIYPNTNTYTNKTYETYISKVINSNLAIANSSYQALNVRNLDYERVTFISGSYDIHYGKTELIGSDNVKNSYLKIKFKNLLTHVGSLKYIDLYKNPGNNYVGRYPIIAHNMLESGSEFNDLSDFTGSWALDGSGSYSDLTKIKKFYSYSTE